MFDSLTTFEKFESLNKVENKFVANSLNTGYCKMTSIIEIIMQSLKSIEKF